MKTEQMIGKVAIPIDIFVNPPNANSNKIDTKTISSILITLSSPHFYTTIYLAACIACNKRE